MANLGCGMIVPTVVSWGLQGVPGAIRGRVTGILMACNFLGQFLSAYVMVWLKERGDLSSGVFDYCRLDSSLFEHACVCPTVRIPDRSPHPFWNAARWPRRSCLVVEIERQRESPPGWSRSLLADTRTADRISRAA